MKSREMDIDIIFYSNKIVNQKDFKFNRVVSLIKKTTEKTIRRHTTKSPAVVIEIHEN